MKKSMLVTLVMALLMFMASSYSFAQLTGVADTSKEGSLLIWPLVETSDNNETFIIINNGFAGAGPAGEEAGVYVKRYWEVKSDPNDPSSTCYLSDVAFFLSVHNPLIFKASDGTGIDGRDALGGSGIWYPAKAVLKCWAVDETQTRQISWNHLSGSAIIINQNGTTESGWTGYGKETALMYNAWRFAANVVDQSDNQTFADGFWVGRTIDTLPTNGVNTMNLAGLTGGKPTRVNPLDCQYPYSDSAGCSKLTAKYDACPRYLTFDFLSEPTYAKNYLALVPCKENLADVDDPEALPEFDLKTRLVFTVWNENEVKYTGTYQCSTCILDMALANIATTAGRTFFETVNLRTPSGRFRVEGLANAGKCGGAVATSLVGVMYTEIVKTSPDPNVGLKSRDLVSTTPTIGGAATADPYRGFVKWAPTGLPEEKKHR